MGHQAPVNECGRIDLNCFRSLTGPGRCLGKMFRFCRMFFRAGLSGDREPAFRPLSLSAPPTQCSSHSVHLSLSAPLTQYTSLPEHLSFRTSYDREGHVPSCDVWCFLPSSALAQVRCRPASGRVPCSLRGRSPEEESPLSGCRMTPRRYTHSLQAKRRWPESQCEQTLSRVPSAESLRPSGIRQMPEILRQTLRSIT